MAFRLIQYSGFNANQFNPTLQYIYDSTIGPSGAYRVVTPSDMAGIGSVSSSNVNISGQSTNLSVGLTGTNNVTFTNSGIFVSGVVRTQSINSGVFSSGTYAVLANLSGASSGVSGTPAGFLFDSIAGGLIVATPNLSKVTDSIVAYEPSASAIRTGAIQGVNTSNGVVAPANSNRNQFYLQNLSLSGLFVSLSGNASVTNFNVYLKPASTDMGPDGGTISFSNFLGAISVSGSGTPKFTSFEF